MACRSNPVLLLWENLFFFLINITFLISRTSSRRGNRGFYFKFIKKKKMLFRAISQYCFRFYSYVTLHAMQLSHFFYLDRV